MPRANEQVIQLLTTTESSVTYKYRKRKGHDILVYSLVAADGGAISGTYVLEATIPGGNAWATVADGTFTNTEAHGTFVPGGNIDIRWTCTVAGTDVTARIG